MIESLGGHPHGCLKRQSKKYMIELITASTLLVNALYGTPATINIENVSEIKNTAKEQKLNTPDIEMIERVQPINLDKYVQDYFKDTPILYQIAKCESSLRHIGKDGKVVKGEVDDRDTGLMQINLFYHEKSAEKLGFDLHTLKGNMAYAKWLYKREGLKPWASSSKCWLKNPNGDLMAIK